MSELSANAMKLLSQRYFHEGEKTWQDLVHRVVKYVAVSDRIYELAYSQIANRLWIPNSPALAGAGTKNGGMFACFVAGPSSDSMESHLATLTDIAMVGKFGGGCGFTGTNFRPKGYRVFGSAHGSAYGPNKWALQVSNYLDIVTQGGFRRMALMYTMRSDHADLDEFIGLKQSGDERFAYNFNQSIMATDHWMEDASRNENSKASAQLDAIAYNAWSNGEPGLLFYDTININTPYAVTGQRIEATNPCGEQPLPEYGACNLGSIAIANNHFYDSNGKFSFDKLEPVVRTMTRFLDLVGTRNKFPTQKFETWYKDNRPIGIGLMGLADSLIRQEIAYGSQEAQAFLASVMKFNQEVSYDESEHLGREFGIPVNCDAFGRRNITTTSIAPTGSIAMLADTSHSIEPIFAPTYLRTDERGETYTVEHPLGSSQFFRSAINDDSTKVPSPIDHINMQAAAQRYCDSGVSKTVNLPSDCTPDQIRNLMLYAWSNGCKGITVYRDKSRQTQVITPTITTTIEITEDIEFDPSCPTGVCAF